MRSIDDSIKEGFKKLCWLLLLSASIFALPALAITPSLSAPEYDEGTYTVSWNAGLDHVELEEKPTASSDLDWEWRYSGATQTSKQFIKSSNGSWDYRVKSCASTEGGPGGCSAWVYKTVTVQLPPSAPFSLGSDITDQDGTYTLSWGAATGIVTYYKIYEDTGGSPFNFVEIDTSSNNAYSVEGREDGDYAYKVQACNNGGCGPMGAEQKAVYVRKPPNPPRNSEITAGLIPGNAVLTWEAPQAGTAFDFYRISRALLEPVASDEVTLIPLMGPYVLPIRVPTLEPTEGFGFYVDVHSSITQFNIEQHLQGPYMFRVQTCWNNPLGGNDVCSDESTAAETAPYSFHYPPEVSWTNSPSNSDNGSVPMSWHKSGVSDAESYRVLRERDTTGTNLWGEEVDFDAFGATSYTDSIRENGVYRYRVEACNQAGCGYTPYDEMEVNITADGLIDDVTPVDLLVPTSEYVGSLSESASIDGGNVSYSVEMPVPPGRNGMQPKIGLSYSSDGGNGLVGVGWSLNAGNGAVYRCPNIAAAGGENRPYLGLEDDRLCLNGQHLMLVSGSYGRADSTYRTEITDYAEIKLLSGSSQTASSYFEVTHKSGAISRYQYTWVPQSGGFPTHWYLTQEEDLSGNQVDYVYTQGVEPVLQNIYYTGFGGQQGNRNVKFVYEDRPQQQKHYGYKPRGGRDYGTQRLSRIETYLGSTLVHSMNPTYESSALTDRSLLKELQICDANGDCLPKSIYAYNDQSRDFALDTLVEGEWSQIYFVGDHDGDGKSDSIKEVIDWNPDGSGDNDTYRYLLLSSRPGTQFPESAIGFALPNKNTFDSWSDLLLDGKRDFLVAGSDLKLDVVSIEYVSAGTPAQVNTTTIDTNLALPGSSAVFQVADFNADGRPDVLVSGSGARTVHLNCTDYSEEVSALQFCASITPPDPYAVGAASHYDLAEITDFNQDGLPDLLFSGWNENQPGVLHDHLIAYAQKSGGNFSFSELETSPYQVDSTTQVLGLDANGDGLQDRLLLRENASTLLQINDGTGNYVTATVSGSFGLEEHLEHGLLSIDYDGDGRDELLVPDSLVADFCFNEVHRPNESEGGETNITYCNEGVQEGHQFSSNDGKSFAYNRALFSYRKLSFDWTGHTAVSLNFAPTELVLPLGQSQVCDANGDGLPDICYDIENIVGIAQDLSANLNAGSYHQSVVRGTHAWINSRSASTFGEDLLAYTTNGLGQERFWQYAPLSGVGSELCAYGEETPFYTVNRSVNAPGHYHFGSTMPVVSRYASSNGVGGMNSQCYRYEDAMYSAMGRGFQGFRAISVDAQVEGDSYSTITRTEYHDQFPLTGRVKQAEVRLSTDAAGADPLSRTISLWNWQYDNGTGIHQVFHESNTEQTFDLESRDLLGKTTVISRYYTGQDMQYGNPSRRETTKESYLNGTQVVRDRTDIDYRYDYGDASGGWTNKLERQAVTTQPTEYFGSLAAILPDGTANNSKLVTTDYQYYNDGTRRLQRETLQQGVANEENFRQLGYDPYGNLTSVTLGAPGEQSRASSTVYQSDGYFPYEHYNALGHKSRTEYDDRFGVVGMQLSANNVRTDNRYNDMGALYKVEADGQQPVSTSTQFCDAGCPALAVSKRITVQNGSPVVTEYLDMVGRTIKSLTQAFDGNPSVAAVAEYDAHGWKLAESQPSHHGTAYHLVRYEDFDELGRYRRKTVDRSGHMFGEQQWTYDYAGLSTTITLPDGTSTATRVIDANGLLLSTTDAAGSSTHYRYDSLGNKVLIQDHQGNQVRYYFDNLSRKVLVEDPDAGTAAIPAAVNLYNGFGEVVTTTNANGDVLVFDYDLLGRAIHRYINGALDAQWTYDLGEKPGTLSRVDMPLANYWQGIVYDDLVRPISIQAGFDVTESEPDRQQLFYTAIAYDANHGRVKGKYFSSGEYVEFLYDKYGNRIEERDPIDGTVYYSVGSVNARGQVLSATYGNDLTLDQGYYDSTGDAEAIQVNGTLGSLLDLHYQFADPFGNLTEQENRLAGAVETFHYDTIQRLIQSSKNWSGGIQAHTVDYDYDAVGNILLKSDFGDVYQYGSADRGLGGNAGPHAVRRVEKPGGGAIEDFQYDNAGNMIAGNGRATVYNAYNKPLQVQENGGTTIFTYGPDLQLIKREDGDRTIYYGSDGVQRVIEGSQITERTPLTANVLVEDGPGGRKVRYQHYDRLSSLVLVTDEGGQVTESHGFDAFGKAQEGNWQDSGGLLHSGANGEKLTEKGYTGHEHLDKHKLVHMGGRVYDPLLGRFMSVDPYIQSETSTQNQNPYSYVMNNPLSMVDPSGYAWRCTDEVGTASCTSTFDIMSRPVSGFIREVFSERIRSIAKQAVKRSNGLHAAKSRPAVRTHSMHHWRPVIAPDAPTITQDGVEVISTSVTDLAGLPGTLAYKWRNYVKILEASYSASAQGGELGLSAITLVPIETAAWGELSPQGMFGAPLYPGNFSIYGGVGGVELSPGQAASRALFTIGMELTQTNGPVTLSYGVGFGLDPLRYSYSCNGGIGACISATNSILTNNITFWSTEFLGYISAGAIPSMINAAESRLITPEVRHLSSEVSSQMLDNSMPSLRPVRSVPKENPIITHDEHNNILIHGVNH